jgi:hypothetical protein
VGGVPPVRSGNIVAAREDKVAKKENKDCSMSHTFYISLDDEKALTFVKSRLKAIWKNKMRTLFAALLAAVAVTLLASCQNAPGADGRYASHDHGTIYDRSGRWAP